MTNSQIFFSPGKLMLTGEYLVLDGALSLAIPTQQGQSLKVNKVNGHGNLHWRAFNYKGDVWFETIFEILPSVINTVSEDSKVILLKKILENARALNPDFLNQTNNYIVETHLDFPNQWGLGSSSTLLTNIAHWAKVDPLSLFKISMEGSGYDIAVAIEAKPLLYELVNGKPQWKCIEFEPAFSQELYFVYLEKKQISSNEIAAYKLLNKPSKDIIERVSEISKELTNAHDLKAFDLLLNEHEILISTILKTETIKQKLFADYKGCIKSLGAWGGDFAMISGTQNLNYFITKGYNTIIPWEKMVKK